MHTTLAYGCHWVSDFPLPLFQSHSFSIHNAEVEVRLGRAYAEDRAFHFANGRLRFCTDGLRYLADDGTVLDLYGASRISVTPGPEWDGVPPPAFYGTITAALLVARGRLPIHGSAVALGEKAVLLCGHSGAGKSTLTAALLAGGAKLLSDDLSAIQAPDAGRRATLFAGRRAVRLFPDLAEILAAHVPAEQLHLVDERKTLVLPPVAGPETSYPLAAILVLGGNPEVIATPEAAALALLEHGYRRRAFRHLPGHSHRVELCRRIAATVPVLEFPRVQARDDAGLRRAADMALTCCDAYLR